MTIGERMRSRRKQLGFSAEYIAEKLGCSPATIYRYENGYIEKMPIDSVSPIASILGVTPAYLMGWEDEFGAEETAAGEGDGLSPLEKRLMQLVHRLSDDQKEMLLAQIELLLSKQG